ncbi:hypothetical protein [Paraburkholderia sp. UYCP14C]|uniref:hypothetical protein n=1 Tax=Paraburkholderia sp. UYCP14C TaxID=2511130 RepID=UPI00145A0298
MSAEPSIGWRRGLFFRWFAPTRFDLATQIREQPTSDCLWPIRRVRREFALVREMDDDGARHYTISSGIVDAVQLHAQRVGSFIFRESQSESDISKTRHYRYDFSEVKEICNYLHIELLPAGNLCGFRAETQIICILGASINLMALLPFKRNRRRIGETFKRAIAFPMGFGLIDKGFFAICNDLETTSGRPRNGNPPMPSALLLEHMEGRGQA